MKKITYNDILDKSEQLIDQLRNVSGLIGVANAAQFEALDENSYTHYMVVLMNLQDETVTLGLEIQNDLYLLRQDALAT